MNVQLLLVLVLVGPFCAFTHASPTELPAEQSTWITETVTHGISEAAVPTEVEPSTTGPPTTEVSPTEVTTEAISEVSTVAETETDRPATFGATEPEPLSTTAQESLATATQDPLTTTLPVVQTEGFTEEIVQTNVIEVDAREMEDVAIENEGLSSGQIVGIVIGALLALVIVIAVVIAVMRRMGKYTP